MSQRLNLKKIFRKNVKIFVIVLLKWEYYSHFKIYSIQKISRKEYISWSQMEWKKNIFEVKGQHEKWRQIPTPAPLQFPSPAKNDLLFGASSKNRQVIFTLNKKILLWCHKAVPRILSTTFSLFLGCFIMSWLLMKWIEEVFMF